MELVILESPYAGDIERNTQYAKECMLDSLKRGEAPMVSHLLYTQCLDDNIPKERKLGIAAGLAWRKKARVHVFCVDLGMSEGMKKAYELAVKEKAWIEVRTIRWDSIPEEVMQFIKNCK